MSRPHQPPAALRYFKARLRPLARPQFWLAITILSLIGVFAGAYFTSREEFAANQQPTVTPTDGTNGTVGSTLTPEEKAIAADIDNSAVLEQDIAVPVPLQLAPETQNEGLFDEFMKQRLASPTTSKSPETQKSQTELNSSNPFSIKLPDTPTQTTSNPGTTTSNISPVSPSVPYYSVPSNSNTNTNPLQTAIDRLNGNNTTLVNPDGTPVNALQTAIDRNSNRNSATTPSQSSSSISPFPQNPATLRQQDQLSNQFNPQLLPVAPGQTTTSTYPNGSSAYPVPNGTGYNLPSGYTNNSVNSYTYLTQPQGVVGVPSTVPVNPSQIPAGNLGQTQLPNSTGYNSNTVNPGLQQVSPTQTQVQPQPFSVPNSIPGRNIGGGQINTFSNP